MADPFRLGIVHVHLVDDWQDLEIVIQGKIRVGKRLRLDALSRIDDEDRSFAGRKRPGYFIGKVNMPWRIDQVEQISFA